MSRLNELKLLAAIHPALTWDAWLDERFSRLNQVCLPPEWGVTAITAEGEFRRDLGYILWLMRLPGEAAEQVCERLVTSVELGMPSWTPVSLWRDLPDLQGPHRARWSAGWRTSNPWRATPLSWLRRRPAASAAPAYTLEWQNIQPTFDGHDLRRMGLPPGPVYSEILEHLARRLAGRAGDDSSRTSKRCWLRLLADPDIRSKLAAASLRSSASHSSI